VRLPFADRAVTSKAAAPFDICVTRRLVGPLVQDRQAPKGRLMDFDDQLRRYFGTSDLGAVTPEALTAGVEHMKVDLGLERDRGRRFALWALLFMLGEAPDLDVVFKDQEDREAAQNFMDLADRAQTS
jgi:hypothetical protein